MAGDKVIDGRAPPGLESVVLACGRRVEKVVSVAVTVLEAILAVAAGSSDLGGSSK